MARIELVDLEREETLTYDKNDAERCDHKISHSTVNKKSANIERQESHPRKSIVGFCDQEYEEEQCDRKI